MEKLDGEYVEVRLKVDALQQLYLNGAQVEVLTTPPFLLSRRRSSFRIQTNLPRRIGYTETFQEIIRQGKIQAVDHGEFQACAEKLIDICEKSELVGVSRPTAISIQRCQRGGKTFMSYAVASILEKHYEESDQSLFVIFMSMSSTNSSDPPFCSDKPTVLRDCQGSNPQQDRVRARMSWKERPFHKFRKQYQDFDAISKMMIENKVILIIDELNVILPTAEDSGKLFLSWTVW